MIGTLAFSKAGHDKNTVYLVINEDENYVYLADGRSKKVNNPKKKNIKHVQLIKNIYNIAIQEKIMQHQLLSDAEIVKVIKDYHRLKEESNV